MARTGLKLLMLFVISYSIFSCEKLDLTRKTSVEVSIIDEVGSLSECNIRLIEPDPDYWDNLYSNKITLPGTTIYKFEDVEPGDYAALIGNISDTYKEFSVKKGDQVKIQYTYYVSGNITVGNPYSGYYTVPLKRWKCSITK